VEQDWPKAQGLRRKATKSNWATPPLRHTDGGQEERRASVELWIFTHVNDAVIRGLVAQIPMDRQSP